MESINTNQVARVNKATIRSKLSSMRWHTEMPSDQDKAGETPHTLHERRPREDKEKQQNSCIDYAQQTEPQQESSRGENREAGLRETAGGQEMSEPTSRETDNHELNRRGFTSEGVHGVLRIR